VKSGLFHRDLAVLRPVLEAPVRCSAFRIHPRLAANSRVTGLRGRSPFNGDRNIDSVGPSLERKVRQQISPPDGPSG
jgi:hypothetical protein